MSQVKIKLFHGPNLYFHEKSVTIFFDYKLYFSDAANIHFDKYRTDLKVLPQRLFAALENHSTFIDATELIAILANAIQCERYSMPLEFKIGKTTEGSSYISISYFSSRGAMSALNYSFYFIHSLFIKNNINEQQKRNRIELLLKEQTVLQPAQTGLAMLKAAKALKIPVYETIQTSRVLCYGQGENSLFFKDASNELDSGVGIELQQNKSETNHLIKNMGYPTTEHIVVRNLEQAKQAQILLGYPLAVKPVSFGMGYGVSSGVSTDKELEAALKIAQKYQDRILIEKHVYGYDHRITVADGKIIGVICRMPAMVVGDGVASIRELIDAENKRRPDALRAEGLIRDIVVDENLLNIIAKEGLTLESIPKKDMEIALRSNANMSTGGTFKNVIEELHPDTANMAIDVARYFRLNVVGMDFMTRDISRSWKEEGAIIEINSPPGIFEELALSQLETKFSRRNNGRVPIFLMIDLSAEQQEKILKEFNLLLNKIAYVSANACSLLGLERKFKSALIADKCAGFLTDPACSTLVVVDSQENLLENGLPVDYFDYCFISHDRNQRAENDNFIVWLKAYCKNLISV